MSKEFLYFDHAATTPIAPVVLDKMMKVLSTDFGNPSAVYALGRKAKSHIELSRKQIATSLGIASSQIVFTSGATEANFTILYHAVVTLGVTHIITSKTEHHAVLENVLLLQERFGITVIYVPVLETGDLDLHFLEHFFKENADLQQRVLVSLMHVNNETGVVLDIDFISAICCEYKAYFHSDTVQSVGKIPIDLEKIPIDFIVCSAHKLQGPKGVGFFYFRKGIPFRGVFAGGSQEKGLRAGTQGVHNIVGMAVALQHAIQHLEIHTLALKKVKTYFIQKATQEIPELVYNAQSDEVSHRRSFGIVNMRFTQTSKDTKTLLFALDLQGVACASGSACQSGSTKSSHVLTEILSNEVIQMPSIRISFSSQHSLEHIDQLIQKIKTAL